ncbi:MAG TPA: hypothetical protein PKL33_13685, partial [Accumulibacter sp.]|nr:hypothetical protein [Accumulibacter sp.]
MSAAVSTLAAALSVRRDGEMTLVVVSGNWRLGQPVPDPAPALAAVDGADALRLAAEQLGDWDSSLLAFLLRIHDAASARGQRIDCQLLPDGLARLIR